MRGTKGTKGEALALAGAVLLFFLGYIWFRLSIFTNCERTGDYALLALDVEKAKRFATLLGPYSRFAFRHPGPLALYYYAAVDWMFAFLASPQSRILASQILLNAFCIISAGLIVLRGTRRFAAAALFICSVLLALQQRDLLHMIWNPGAIVAPFILFLVSAATVMCGRLEFLFPATLGFAFAGSHHLGSLSVLLPLACLSIAGCFRERKLSLRKMTPCERVSIAGSACLIMLAVAPPSIEALQNGGGNVRRLIDFFTDPGSSQHSLSASVRYISAFYQFPSLKSPIERALALSLSLSLPYLIRDPGPYLTRIRILCLVGVTASIYGATRVQGPLYGYLMLFQSAIAAVLWWLSFLSLSALIGRLLTRAGISYAVIVHFPKAGLLALIPLLSYPISSSLKLEREVRRTCNSIVPEIVREVSGEGSAVKIALNSPGDWKVAAAIFSKLYEARIDVCMMDQFGFLVGRELSCRNADTRARTTVLVLPPAEAQRREAQKIIIGRSAAVIIERDHSPKSAAPSADRPAE